MYIPQAHAHTSTRTRDLTAQLRATIDAYQLKHPKTSAEEIRAALAAVTPGTRYTKARGMAILATVLFFLGVFGAVINSVERVRDGEPVAWILLLALLAPALALVLMLWLRTQDD